MSRREVPLRRRMFPDGRQAVPRLSPDPTVRRSRAAISQGAACGSVRTSTAWWSAALVAFLLAPCAAPGQAGESPAAAGAEAAGPPPGTRRALIICGHPGDAERRAQFAETIGTLRTVLIERYGFRADAVWVLFGGEDAEADAPAPDGLRGDSTQESIARTVAELRSDVQPDDALWVVAMGHTYYDGRRAWFNLPGPDLHEQTFSQLFDGLSCRELVFWITIPASGFYIRPLAAEGRVIITATEADREINETIFPHVFAEVLANTPEAFDADGNGRRTLFDLYVAVTRAVAQRYSDDMQLSTEHALLEDNGDGRGTEVQIDYLPEELGGRATEGATPPRLPNADGARSASIALPRRE